MKRRVERGNSSESRTRGRGEGTDVMQSSSRPSRRNLSSVSYESLFFPFVAFQRRNTNSFDDQFRYHQPRLDRLNLITVHSHPLTRFSSAPGLHLKWRHISAKDPWTLLFNEQILHVLYYLIVVRVCTMSRKLKHRRL